jgi:UDP-N-acetylmuramoyl-tripeptide--D-alanyl-D-alanine ligase
MNHPGEISRLGAICRPTIGVITNVGPAHLEFLGSLEGVARAKAELIDHIDKNGVLILNADDPNVAGMAEKAGGRRILFFGQEADADARAVRVADSGDGLGFDLILPAERIEIRLNTKGRFMVTNALAAAAVGTALGIDAPHIKQGLENFHQTQGRMVLTRLRDDIVIIDDTYNANPASMKAAIDSLNDHKSGAPGILVVGDMFELGATATHFHRQLGRQAAGAGMARLYACGAHAGDVATGAMASGMSAAAIFTGTKEAILQDLIDHLEPGSWVLVKGSRAMAMENIVEDLIRMLNR